MSDQDMSVDIETRRAVEAIVLAATEPVHPTVMAQLLELSVETIDELCAQLAAEYEAQGRGFQLARVAGGYRFQTHPDAYAYVERFVLDGQTARAVGSGARDAGDHRLQAARVARAAVGDPRCERRRDAEDAWSRAATSTRSVTIRRRATRRCSRRRGLFLERLGLNSLTDLPALADFVPESSIVEALERGLLFVVESSRARRADEARRAPTIELDVTGER